jgi:hypothetical protein
MCAVELWHRHWSRLDLTGSRYTGLENDQEISGHGPIWLCTEANVNPIVNGKPWLGEPDNTLSDGRRIFVMPIPLRGAMGMKVSTELRSAQVNFPEIPDRPLESTTGDQQEGKPLRDRVKSVWARLREVEMAVADPAHIWESLRDLWLRDDAVANPEMDIIVHHGRRLLPTLDLLDRAPRKVLRRTQRMIPLSRVQEVDRKTMSWLIRQPGETIAERAGNRQRIKAVTREENFNTLENRVVLSYARLAGVVAREYAGKHAAVRGAARVKLVAAYGKRCRLLERGFDVRGVLEANADVTPNFVLQTNPNYRKIWGAWHELLNRGRILDELWRWQTRSWEEFCALATIIALQSVPGARPVATSPIVFRDEQERGCWIKNVNPLAVFFLPSEGVTIEVSYRMRGGNVLPNFGAPIWLRLGKVGGNVFLQRWAVWPIWDAIGGLEAEEAEEILRLLPAGRNESVVGGITIRPAAEAAPAEIQSKAGAACLTVGASGPALKAGIEQLRDFLLEFVLKRAV